MGHRISTPVLDNPGHPKIKASPRKKRTNIPSPARGLGKGDGLKFGISRAGTGRGCGCSKRWGPRPPQAGPALTKQLSMEQETRAVRLMVAGGLGQRTCPRSRCAARQCRAPAAFRLRGRPGAAAAARGRARAAGPRRGSRAPLPSWPQWSEPSSALRHERGREGSPERGAPRPRGESGGGAGSRGPAHRPGLLPPRTPLAAWEGVLRGRLGAFRSPGCGTAPKTVAGEGGTGGMEARDRLHLFNSHLYT